MTERNTELPLVRIAVTCENVIEDRRDGTLSLIKIIDQVTIYRLPGAPPAPDVMEPTAVQVVMVIGTVADKARGQRSLTVHVIAPDGTVRPVGVGGGVLRVDYDEANAMRNWIVRLSLMASAIGTFWLEVRCDGQPLTRMPLRILYAPNLPADGQGQ